MFGQLGDTDLKSIRTFYTIGKCGGFTPAQVELGVSAATISTQMSQLEVRLGMKLCHRGQGGFRLTDEGGEVFRACEKLFGSIEIFKNEVIQTSNVLTGELRIGLISRSITHPDLPINETLAEFGRRAQQTRLNLYVGLETEIESRVIDGRLHAGITILREKVQQLNYKALTSEDFLLYCGQDHPLFNVDDKKIELAELSEFPYVSGDYWEQLRGFSKPFVALVGAETPDFEGMARLVLSGHYIGYLPTHYAQQWVSSKEMRAILPDQTSLSATIALITTKGAEKPRTLEVFLECLASHYPD